MKEESLFVNAIPALYEIMKKGGQEEDAKRLIEKFLTESFTADISEKIQRFRNTGISPIRADTKYFQLFIEVLQIYVNGLFYSTVVLAGVLCERVCFDRLSEQKIVVGETQLSEEQISFLYRMDFSRMAELLHSWGLIDKETKDEMFQIYEKRNRYVHPRMEDISPENDSLDMLKSIIKILVHMFGK